MLLSFITWNVNPEIFSIGPIHVRYYGLLFALSFVCSYLLFSYFFKRDSLSLPLPLESAQGKSLQKEKPLKVKATKKLSPVEKKGTGKEKEIFLRQQRHQLLDALTVWAVISTLVGLRLGHCLFYDPIYYLSHPIEILKIWEGGLASHGAAIGVPLGLYFFCRKYKMNYLWLLDRIVVVVALTGFFIRTGNLMNSEIYGIQTSLPWGFIFKYRGEVAPKHPTQIYEALAYLLIFFILLYVYQKKTALLNRKGFLFGAFLVLVFTFRFFVEFIKERQVAFEEGMPLDMGQLLSIPFVLLGVFMLAYSLRQKPKATEKAEALA
ncbi:MAG: prolipoprotein diacylglyceryl transferase [Prevotellaceae bacterium]|jgi:prolipoprotein diacylglyceryl transferase|nr:prolipoprotein diacylglyceryl transferase [Prevotellaceae bacterium]